MTRHSRRRSALLLVLCLAALLFAPFVSSADLVATPAPNESDVIFNYAEATYPQFLSPAGAASRTAGIYYYRYYPGTNAYIATGNGRFYYLGPASNNQILDLGASSDWLSVGRNASTSGTPTTTGFGAGIFYRLPVLDNPGANLARIGTAPSLEVAQMSPTGWDMCSDYLVFPTSSGLTLVTPSGQRRSVPVTDIFFLARPALSPDCRYVAVQAQATSAPTAPGTDQDLNIYVIDLQSGASRRIGNLRYNEESPRFFPVGRRLAYSSFSPTEGTNLHVYDLDQDREIGFFRDIGALQIAISPDGAQFIDPRKMRIYRLDTGVVVADLLDRAVRSLQAAGFQLDQRFNDQATGHRDRGVYPLDAAFSPTGQQLVLDWAVLSGTTYGNVLVTMSVTGSDFSVSSGLIATNPQFTNSNNFSQLNPLWK